MEVQKLTLEELEDSIVGKEYPLWIDWEVGGQIVLREICVKVAEPNVAEEITHKYVVKDRQGNAQKINKEKEKEYLAELFQRFFVSPSLKKLGTKTIVETIFPKIPLTARGVIERTILGDLSEVIVKEAEILKNFEEVESAPDMNSSDSQPSTTDSN